jgi:hypothetical protein
LAKNSRQIRPHELVFQKSMQQNQRTSFARIGIGNGCIFIEDGRGWYHKNQKTTHRSKSFGI